MRNKGEARKLIVKVVPLKRFSKGGDIQEDIRLWALDQKRRASSKEKPPEPPEKPPRPPFIDRNLKAFKWIVGNPIVRWIAGSAIWDWLHAFLHFSIPRNALTRSVHRAVSKSRCRLAVIMLGSPA